MFRCFDVFMRYEGWTWYHSSVCTLLYISYVLHDFIAWMKIRPFLSRRASLIYLITLCCAVPYWIVETYANFTYYNFGYVKPFTTTRVLEAAFRCVDPVSLTAVI